MPPRTLGELLVSQGVINPEQLKAALIYKKTHQTRLVSSLIQLGHVNEKVLATFFSKVYGLSAISLDGVHVPPEVARLVSQQICEKYLLVPLSVENKRLSIAISDPTNATAVDEVRVSANMEVEVFIATDSAIRALILETYQSSSISAIAPEPVPIARVEVEKKQERVVTGVHDVGKPVIRFLNNLLSDALKRKASDIHIEPYEDTSRVRFRIDGALHEVMNLPGEYRSAVPARIKVMAELDISEKRLPQDGRFQVKTTTNKIDVRVSTLPTLFGEKIVMRLLDQGTVTPDLRTMGYEPKQLELFRKATQLPYGMVLVTGPTGSGKSTTLYAALSELNKADVNISTVEDPAEYNMKGINQVQTKEDIGLTFAATLRSLLRQDPDIILVGEIRDQETGEIAIKASLTGHLVFSTLHTNDASSAITRLLHMGVEPFLITASVTLVQAQRLVRVICDNCKTDDPSVTPQMLSQAEMTEEMIKTCRPVRGTGCEKCSQTGYRGRIGIFEVMPMSEGLRDMVVDGKDANALRKLAMSQGMQTLRQNALIKLHNGITTLEEVLFNSRADGDLT